MRWMALIAAVGMLSCNPPIRTCGDGVDCEDCLTIASCSYSMDQCRSTCVPGAECYGPGNPAALTCPDDDDDDDDSAS